MALRNLLLRVGADVSGLKKSMGEAERSVAFFGRSVGDAMKGLKGKIAGGLAGIASGVFVGEGVKDAMRYEALMTTLGESMGESRKDFEKWSATVGKSFGYSRLQAAQLANTLSLNFKQIATSQADLTSKTTKMMEVAAVIANKRGLTMEEVSDRIRSAMNAEADGADELGVNVRIAAIQQSKAYQEMANGQPWDKLSSNMQKTILYSHILESVTNNLGSSMQDTTALRMAVFSASLADVRMALGQAFLPILYNVLPILTTFMNYLYKALQVVAAFSKALFGGFNYKDQAKGATTLAAATNKQAAAVGGLGKAQDKTAKSTKKAAKAAKGGVAAFDEVNTLADKADSSGAGAGAGGGGGAGAGGAAMPAMSALPTPDNSGFKEKVDEMVAYFKKKLEPIKKIAKTVYDYISSYVQIKFAGLIGFWNKYGDQIIAALKNAWNLIKPVIMFLVKFIWDSVKGLIDGVIQFFEGIIEFFTGVFTGDWKLAWQGLKDIFFGALKAIWNFTNLTLFGGIKKIFLALAKDGIGIVLGLGKGIVKLFGSTFADVVKAIKGAWTTVKMFFLEFGAWFEQKAVDIAWRVISGWEKIGKVGKTIWNAIKAAFNGAVNWFIRTIITPIANRFEDIKNAFKHGATSGFKSLLNNIRNPLNSMISGANKMMGALHIPIHIKEIPYLAKGGIATGPTLAMVGEGSQDEAIAPLDKLQGFIANAVVAAMRAVGPAGGTSGDIILNLDGRTFARIIKPHMDKEFKRIGTNVRLNPI